MKKSLLLIAVTALILLVVMTQCKKNYSCGLKVVCKYTTTGLDTGKVVPKVSLDIYPGSVKPGSTVHPSIDSVRYVMTDDKGFYQHTYPYEALLNITATHIDSVENDDGQMVYTNYRGTAQVKLQEGRTVEKVILLMEE